MMKKCINDYNDLKNQAAGVIETYNTYVGYSLYICCTKYRRKKMFKLNRDFINNEKMDFELGIISEETYKKSQNIYMLIENSLADATTY